VSNLQNQPLNYCSLGHNGQLVASWAELKPCVRDILGHCWHMVVSFETMLGAFASVTGIVKVICAESAQPKLQLASHSAPVVMAVFEDLLDDVL
jgi:hypothetical protein